MICQSNTYPGGLHPWRLDWNLSLSSSAKNEWTFEPTQPDRQIQTTDRVNVRRSWVGGAWSWVGGACEPQQTHFSSTTHRSDVHVSYFILQVFILFFSKYENYLVYFSHSLSSVSNSKANCWRTVYQSTFISTSWDVYNKKIKIYNMCCDVHTLYSQKISPVRRLTVDF